MLTKARKSCLKALRTLKKNYKQFTKLFVLLILGLGFSGGGLFVLSETAWPMWADWYGKQNWQPVNGRLFEVSVGSNYTSARYQYEFGGRSYSGNRVYGAKFGDDIGSYQRTLLDRLKEKEGSNESITIWVDPHNPEQAVIDRDMRWGLFILVFGFGSIFVVIGLLVTCVCAHSDKNKSRSKYSSLSELRKEWEQKLDDPNFADSFLQYKQRHQQVLGKGDEIRMFFPMFRNRLFSFILGIFSGGFGFAGYSTLASAFKGGWFGILIGLFSVPFVLVAVISSIGFVYLTFNNLRVSITPAQITVLRRLLFIPVYYRQLQVADISRLAIKCSGSTGSGVKKIEHFKIQAHDEAGNRVTLAEDIDGKEEATYLCDYLTQRLNLELGKKI